MVRPTPNRRPAPRSRRDRRRPRRALRGTCRAAGCPRARSLLRRAAGTPRAPHPNTALTRPPASAPGTSAPPQTKGTFSFGRRTTGKSHVICVRCGKSSFHTQKHLCSSCGYPHAKMRSFNWSAKAHRRRTEGVGRMKHLRTMTRRFKNGFRENTAAKKQKAKAAQ